MSNIEYTTHFVHAMTAMLLWHVQKCIVNALPEMKYENEFTIKV